MLQAQMKISDIQKNCWMIILTGNTVLFLLQTIFMFTARKIWQGLRALKILLIATIQLRGIRQYQTVCANVWQLSNFGF